MLRFICLTGVYFDSKYTPIHAQLTYAIQLESQRRHNGGTIDLSYILPIML